MAIGFRKSLLGFNCNDVIEYIERTHKKFKKQADTLSNQAKDLTEKLEKAQKEYDALLAEKNEISQKLDAFKEKADEIERLSENIGKLYLVSQSNAQAIISNAEESNALTMGEVEKNLSAIDDAHASLNALRANIVKTSDDFIKEVDNMLSSLDITRQQITQNTQNSQEAIEDFETVFQSIINE